MSTTPPPPVAPIPDDDDARTLIGDDDRPLDPDLNEDKINSAEADRRAATEGELEDSDEQ